MSTEDKPEKPREDDFRETPEWTVRLVVLNVRVSWPARGPWRPLNVQGAADLSGLAGGCGRRCRQDFTLRRKPMLIGLAVHAAMCGPDLVSAIADAVFQALIHVRSPAD
jgi:hypothetical protein